MVKITHSLDEHSANGGRELAESVRLSFILSRLDPVCPLQMNASVGLNIFSAICSAVGIILFITDMCLTGPLYSYPSDNNFSYYGTRVSVLSQRSLSPLSYVQTIPQKAWQLSLPSDSC